MNLYTSRSDVGDLIEFEPSEEEDVLSWQGDQERKLSCSEMIEEIARFQREFLELPMMNAFDEEIILKKFIEKYAIINTDLDKKQDAENLLKLLDHLEKFYKSEEARNSIPLLEESIVREGHKITMSINNKCLSGAKSSKFSIDRRMTTYKGKTYFYQQPDDMTEATSLLLDRFNSLYTAALHINDPVNQLSFLFRTIAWFLFEILDLHPFGNGNGRIFRGICSYFLTPVTPFYSPIYLHHCKTDDNYDHSKCPQPCKDVYEQALWDTHEIQGTDNRKPRKLLSLIIFCNWKTWKEFLNEARQCNK